MKGYFNFQLKIKIQFYARLYKRSITQSCWYTYLQGLMPIHCCVMQGRIDVMQLLLGHDQSASMAAALSKESDKKPPSLIHLALANDFPDCAQW